MWFSLLKRSSLLKTKKRKETLSTFRPYSGYIKVFDGSGAQIFTREGCQKKPASNTFLEIAFEESQNVTIQVSLNNNQSYARVSYGILKNGLDSGEGLQIIMEP